MVHQDGRPYGKDGYVFCTPWKAFISRSIFLLHDLCINISALARGVFRVTPWQGCQCIKLTQVRENLYGRSRLLTREAEAVVPLSTLSCAVGSLRSNLHVAQPVPRTRLLFLLTQA